MSSVGSVGPYLSPLGQEFVSGDFDGPEDSCCGGPSCLWVGAQCEHGLLLIERLSGSVWRSGGRVHGQPTVQALNCPEVSSASVSPSSALLLRSPINDGRGELRDARKRSIRLW